MESSGGREESAERCNRSRLTSGGRGTAVRAVGPRASAPRRTLRSPLPGAGPRFVRPGCTRALPQGPEGSRRWPRGRSLGPDQGVCAPPPEAGRGGLCGEALRGLRGDASRAGDTGSASLGPGHSVESAAQEARIVASGAPAGPPGAADSLLPWRESLPQDLGRRGACARAVCVRHPPAPPDPAVLLWGSPCQPPKDR